MIFVLRSMEYPTPTYRTPAPPPPPPTSYAAASPSLEDVTGTSISCSDMDDWATPGRPLCRFSHAVTCILAENVFQHTDRFRRNEEERVQLKTHLLGPLSKTHTSHLVTGLLEAASLLAMLSARDWFPGNAFQMSLKAWGSPLAMADSTVW